MWDRLDWLGLVLDGSGEGDILLDLGEVARADL